MGNSIGSCSKKCFTAEDSSNPGKSRKNRNNSKKSRTSSIIKDSTRIGK